MAHQNPLRFNIGFIIHETPGYSRTFEFKLPTIELDEETTVSDLVGSATFSKTQQGILVEVEASGTTPAQCSHCLDDIEDFTLSTSFTELYAFDERDNTESELAVPDEGLLDLSPLIKDFLLLDQPINPICKPDCKGLCPTCGINRNHENCEHDEESIDPRLAKLKDLLEKKNKEEEDSGKNPAG